ncbi:MAG: glycosyltransferase [Hyphomicrobiales bacterium]|nr:glycosyltransferase [Hyphomicrobiales bacterium]
MPASAKKPLWFVVTPVFDDRESFTTLCKSLAAESKDLRYHVVAVDDGSLAAPPEPADIAASGLDGEVLRLARNVGHQAAIAIGLARVADHELLEDAEGCIVMDCDGEDAPAAVPDLIKAVETPSEDIDIVVAARARRSETLTFRAFYVLYRFFFRLLTGWEIRFGNFMAMKPAAVHRLTAMHETWTHVAGAVVKSRLRRKSLPVDRAARYSGQSRMNFIGLVLHGMRAVMVFADAVLTRMTLLCIAMASLTVLSIATALTLKAFGRATPGWVTTVTGFSLTIFVQIGVLTMITLIINGLTRFESPKKLKRLAQDTIAKIEPTTGA